MDKSRRVVDAAVLIAVTALTRFAFRSHFLYDIDSVNFALGMARFDPSVHQPHPPGYFLYVCLARLADFFFHDANASLVALSIVFSCGAAALIYLLAEAWFGRTAAVFAGWIFVFSPLAWFHGTVALIYIAEAFFSALIGYLCWRVERGEIRWIVPAAVAVGVVSGFRPSSLLLLCPLLFFSCRHASRGRMAAGAAALAATLAAWFFPMLWIAGARPYLSSLLSLWLTVPSRTTVFNSSAANTVARAGLIVAIYFLCFGCAALLPLWKPRASSPSGPDHSNRRKIVFTLVWIVPGLLVFAFVYLKFVNSGYLLVLTPPVFAWMGARAFLWYSNLRCPRALKISLAAACAAANAAIFIWAPLYCSFGAVRRFEAQRNTIVETLPQIASPRDTMIVGFDSHFLGYRHAGYYLPHYLTVEFPAVSLAAGTRIFAMRHRDTRLLRTLDLGPIEKFVIFPAPPGDKEFSAYMEDVLKRFPPGTLRVITRGGYRYALGPVAALPFLFPDSTAHAGFPSANRPVHPPSAPAAEVASHVLINMLCVSEDAWAR